MSTWTDANPHPESEIGQIDRLLARLGMGLSGDPSDHAARRLWFVNAALKALLTLRDAEMERFKNEPPRPIVVTSDRERALGEEISAAHDELSRAGITGGRLADRVGRLATARATARANALTLLGKRALVGVAPKPIDALDVTRAVLDERAACAAEVAYVAQRLRQTGHEVEANIASECVAAVRMRGDAEPSRRKSPIRYEVESSRGFGRTECPPQFATGGIVERSPRALLGRGSDRGPEFVVPLGLRAREAPAEPLSQAALTDRLGQIHADMAKALGVPRHLVKSGEHQSGTLSSEQVTRLLTGD